MLRLVPRKWLKKQLSVLCNTIHIAITLLLMFGFGHLPTFSTVTPVGMKLLGVFLGVVYGYSTCEVIWPSLFAFIAFGTERLCRDPLMLLSHP